MDEGRAFCVIVLGCVLAVVILILCGCAIDNRLTQNMAKQGLCYDHVSGGLQWEKCK